MSRPRTARQHDLVDQAAAFIKKLVDWPDVIVTVFLDKYGGVRVDRVWSSKSKWGVGWNRVDLDPKPMAIILAVEDFILRHGAKAYRRRLKHLIRMEVDD